VLDGIFSFIYGNWVRFIVSTKLSSERKNEDRGHFDLISCGNVHPREGMQTFRRNIPVSFSGLSVSRLRVWSGYNKDVKFVPPCDPMLHDTSSSTRCSRGVWPISLSTSQYVVGAC
jgi:hypothetical protein